MSANYERTVKSGLVWDNPIFESLDALEKLFYFLLITGQETSDTSVYLLSPKKIAYVLDCSKERALELIEKFEKLNLIKYDYETNEVLVLFYFQHNPPRGGLRYLGYGKDMAKITSSNLIDALAENAKGYPITRAFFLALKDYADVDESDFDIKKTTAQDDEIISASERGRARIKQIREQRKEALEILNIERMEKELLEWEQS